MRYGKGVGKNGAAIGRRTCVRSGRASRVSSHTVSAEPTKKKKINPVLGRYGVSGEKGGDADGNGNQGLVRYRI